MKLRMLVPAALLAAMVVPGSAAAASGVFQFSFGKNVDSAGGSGQLEVCTAGALCQAGEEAAEGGAMQFPYDVAADPQGNIWVADYVNARVQKFGPNGAFLLAVGADVDSSTAATGPETCVIAANCKAGATPAAALAVGGTIGGPNGVATDAAGNVYISEGGYDRVQVLDPQGNFLRMWGRNVDATGGSGFAEVCTDAASCRSGENTSSQGGEFNSPFGIAVDPAGAVYVSDQGFDRVQKFDLAGNFVAGFGKDVSISSAPGFAETCAPSSDCQAGSDATAQGGEFNNPADLAIGPGGSVLVADSQNNRIQRLSSSGSFEIAWGKNVDSAGGSGALETCSFAADCQGGENDTARGGEFSAPWGVAADATGRVHVADASNKRIQVFSSNGDFVSAWGRDVDSTGGSGRAEICIVAAECQIGANGDQGGEFQFFLGGLGLSSAAQLYVAGYYTHRVDRFGDPPTQPCAGCDVVPKLPDPVVEPPKKCKKGQKLKKGKCVKKKRRKRK